MPVLRTPRQIGAWLQDNLHRFDLPAQFLGDEPNARRKSWDASTVRWLMCASWVYEAAAGNSSIPVVYSAVNDGHRDHLCDRWYLPATPRDMKTLHRAGLGVFGIETRRRLADFDVVGSSISYPVLAMTYVKYLTMSAIAPRWSQREATAGTHPMIIVGGQCYGAPEVLAPVVDAWWCGEVEDEPGNPGGVTEVCRRIAAFKADGAWTGDRIGCYAELARQFDFLYFPRFVRTHYGHLDRPRCGPHPSKQVIGYSSTLEGMRLPVRRRIVKNLDNAAPLTAPPLLYADPAMGSGDLEVARGCPAWCSFCALTYRQKPYRQRSVDNVVGYAGELARNMGSVRMAPFSPDFPMYTQKKKLVTGLLENVCDEVDAPTMRVDDFIADERFILLQVYGGMDTVTLGVEGVSQRMRDLVGKGTTDADVRQAVTQGIRAGIRKFKLFLIANLPGEDEADIVRILRLAKDLADIRDTAGANVRIQFSWTPLLIEANTPLQWFAPPVPNRALAEVWDELRALRIDFKLGAKAETNKLAFFQLCQRASRDVGEAIVDAMLEVDQACWGGVPRTFAATLENALRARGFHNGFGDCFDERSKLDMFGWEMIDQGISAQLMWATYTQMREFIEHTDSHTYDNNFDERYHGNEWIERCDSRCYGRGCGACDHTDLRIRSGWVRSTDTDTDLSRLRPVDQRSQAVRIRARLRVPDSHRFVDGAHWRFALRRAAFRAEHDTGAVTALTKRSLRLASDAVRYRDWVAGVDYVEFGLTREVDDPDLARFVTAMATHLDGWITVEDWARYPIRVPAMRADTRSLYTLDIDEDPHTALARLAHWDAGGAVPLRLPATGGYFTAAPDTVDARQYVDELWLARDRHRLSLRMLVHGRPNPYQVYAAVFGRASWLEAAGNRAQRLEVFIPAERTQQDFLRHNCRRCRLVIPTNLLDQPYDRRHCPRCADAAAGNLITDKEHP